MKRLTVGILQSWHTKHGKTSMVAAITAIFVMSGFFAPSFIFATTSGPKDPGTGTSVTGIGTVDWHDADNVTSSDNDDASVNLGSGEASKYLDRKSTRLNSSHRL